MSCFVHVCLADALVNGLALGGIVLIIFLGWELVRELRRKRRRRLREETKTHERDEQPAAGQS